MDVVLDGMWAKLKAAEVDISVHVKATINVTPFVARQKQGKSWLTNPSLPI